MTDVTSTDKIQYHTVSASDNQSEVQSAGSDNHPVERPSRSSSRRPWTSTLVLQILTLLWLVPIITLLWLNFKEHKIGASAWCPGGDCYRSLFSSDSAEIAKEFDKNDHNVIGGLQLVAKALEAWFVFVAAALLYLVTMRVASQKEGIPIGHLTKPLQFATPVTFNDSILWATRPKPNAGAVGWMTKAQSNTWLLVVLSVTLFILCNLMGPATAVLVIPTLQWMDTPRVNLGTLVQVNHELQPPADDELWFYGSTGCSSDEFARENFLCTLSPFGESLDGWIASSQATNGEPPGFASQDNVTFQLNSTQSSNKGALNDGNRKNVIWWAPNRQVVSKLNYDYEFLKDVSDGAQLKYTEQGLWNVAEVAALYAQFNKSLELELRRNGPVLGAVSNMWLDYGTLPNKMVIDIDSTRQVRCYANYNLRYTPAARGASTGNFTKCIRNGGGWNATNNFWREFVIDGRYDYFTNTRGPQTKVQIMSSDRSVFLPNGNIASGFDPLCLTSRVNETVCDWDLFFRTDQDAAMYERTRNMVTIEYIMQNVTSQNTTATVNLAVDFAAYLTFTDYVLDPSPATNPMRLVRTDRLPVSPNASETTPVLVHPSWVVAGLSAPINGRIFNRPTTNSLAIVLEDLLLNSDSGLDFFSVDRRLDWVTLLPIMQTLSLIDHSYTPPDSRYVNDEEADTRHPKVYQKARRYIWTYSLSSRTSKFGAATAIFGCIMVLAQSVLGFVDRRRYRSPTQLLVAALEHVPRGEFDGKDNDASEMAKTRFRVEDDDNRAGKFSFHEPQI